MKLGNGRLPRESAFLPQAATGFGRENENNCLGVLEELVSNKELVISHVIFLWPSSFKW